MNKVTTPDTATSEYRREAAVKAAPRPERFALWAVALAVVAMFAGLLTSSDAGASSGSISTQTTSSDGNRYDRIWNRYSKRNKRWARRTSQCESGGDPKALSQPDGTYRGAFQFMKPTWRTSPKTPGGDPIRYRWRVQAVVAVALKKRDGAGHWPNCG